MISPRLFLCGGANVSATDSVMTGRQPVVLDSVGGNVNVHIRLENVARVLCQQLSPRLMDFLEIASYVYSADCTTRRQGAWSDEGSTEPWGRDFAFVVAVREPDFWATTKVKKLIEEVLSFLSNDKYCFTFVPLDREYKDQEPYFAFGDLKDWPFHGLDRVLMFSGGLDSLAGAVETASGGQRSVLVSHRPEPKVDSRQKNLFGRLKKRFPDQLFHIPVWINKKEKLSREPTQRTRSFLFTALGTLVAESVQAKGVRFYENGIVSLNFPIADEVLRARASRTTHPLALHLLSSLCAKVTQHEFTVDNPYLFKTKTEVVASLAQHQAADLIAQTCSCSHTMFQSRKRHCGRCSQCIDRRFAVTAAGLLAEDPETDYVLDVFTGSRQTALNRAIAVDYTRHGVELHRRSENDLAAIFNTELSRAVRHGSNRTETAQKIIATHKRHGAVVFQVLEQKVHEQAASFVNRTMDPTSLLAMAVGPTFVGQQTAGSDSALGGGPKQPDSNMLASIHENVKALLARADIKPPSQTTTKKRRTVGHRYAVVFAAILRSLKGATYCFYLDKHKIRPKWPDEQAPPTYAKGYISGEPWRKKIQDEKTRAKTAMKNYEPPEVSNAFVAYMPEEFDELSPLLHSRNSRDASKTFAKPNPHKH